ncbi:MAG TPA: hypothetical protein VF796_16970 [Humisphaera sp.]
MKFSRNSTTRPDAAAVAARPSPVTIEPLEPRRFLSASLEVSNSDVIPGFERMVFNRIREKSITLPNVTKERGVLKLTNAGDQTLRFSDVKVSGPFRILGQMPMSLAPGRSVSVTVQFTANKPPPFTYNQTSGTNAANKAGAYIGSLSFATNDPANPTYSEALAGWFQTKNEDNQEPSLQTMVNLMMDYKTVINNGFIPHLEQTIEKRTLYGEEVASGYWQAADPSKNVGVRQIGSWHTQGDTVDVSWFDKTNKSPKKLYTTAGVTGQSLLPTQQGKPLVKANGSFSPGAATFGFKVQNEWSVDALNPNQSAEGHHIRFFPLRDHFGNLLANTYLMTMDYSQVAASQNWDFQDNVFILSNVKPAGN